MLLTPIKRGHNAEMSLNNKTRVATDVNKYESIFPSNILISTILCLIPHSVFDTLLLLGWNLTKDVNLSELRN